MSANTDDDLKQFALLHAPDLAKDTTELVGEVIAKAFQGVIHHGCEMKMRIRDLETALSALVNEPQDITSKAYRDALGVLGEFDSQQEK